MYFYKLSVNLKKKIVKRHSNLLATRLI